MFELDGILGLTPSERPGFKSYLQHIKDLGYIDSHSLTLQYREDGSLLNLGEFNSSYDSVDYVKLASDEGSVFWGAKIDNYELSGTKISFTDKLSYLVVEPAMAGNVLMIRQKDLFD